MLALAGLVVRLDHRQAANRAFALFLLARGMLNVTQAFHGGGPASGDYWWRVSVYFGIAVAYAALHFAHEYRARYVGAPHRRWVTPLLLLLVVVLELVHARTPGDALYHVDSVGSFLFLAFVESFYLVYAALALRFAVDAGRAGETRRGTPLLVMAVAFGLLPAYAAARALSATLLLLVDRAWPFFPHALDPSPYDWFILGTDVLLVPFVVLVAHRLRAHGRALAGLAVAAASGVLANLVWFPAPGWSDHILRLLDALWTGAFVLLLAYGLLRHQILDIDVKVRWGISKTTIAAVFVAVFFITSELAAKAFTDVAGDEVIGIFAAGLLVFAFAPLQRAADRLAVRAVPVAAAPDAQAGRAAYRSALRVALSDGAVSRAEERELARLARELGLDPVDVLELREETEATLNRADGDAP